MLVGETGDCVVPLSQPFMEPILMHLICGAGNDGTGRLRTTTMEKPIITKNCRMVKNVERSSCSISA